jgi:Fe2+ transport system protein B
MFKKKLIIFIILFAFLFAPFYFVLAVGEATPQGIQEAVSTEGAVLDNPLPVEDINVLVANVIKAILGIIGVAALIMFIYGGILWMTSAGNQERIRQGRETLVWAAVGLAVIFSSYALVNLLLQAFEESSGG